MEQHYISTMEAAKVLGISRIAVFKKIKKGEIKAQKVGRNYIIKQSDVFNFVNGKLSKRTKSKITRAVKRTVREYGETLKMLGTE